MACFFGYWLFECIELLRYPMPTDYRDWGAIDLSKAIYENGSPYSFTDGPPFMFIYGPLFSIIIGSLSIFSVTDAFTAAKTIAFASALISAAVVFFEIFSITGVRLYSALGFCSMLWANYGSGVFFILRPDALGLLICILSLFVIRRGVELINILICSFLIVTAFYTKQYFVFVVAPIFLHILMVKNFKSASIFIGSLAAFFVLSVLSVINLWPAYFYQTLLVQFNSVGGPWSYSLYQATQFGLLYWPFLILAAYYILKIYNKTVILSSGENLYIYTLVAGMLCLVPMGRNGGAFMSYHYQLVLPTLTVVGCLSITRLKSETFRLAAICLIVVVCIYHADFLKFDPIYSEDSLQRWRITEAILEKESGPKLISTPILSHLPGDFTRLDNGHSECYTALVSRPYPILNWLFPNRAAYFSGFKGFYDDIAHNIINKKYKLIVVTSGYHPMIPQSILEKYYRKSYEIDLQTGRQVWKTEFWTLN